MGIISLRRPTEQEKESLNGWLSEGYQRLGSHNPREGKVDGTPALMASHGFSRSTMEKIEPVALSYPPFLFFQICAYFKSFIYF